MKGRASQYACKNCSTRTSEFVGTFFENARLTPQQKFSIGVPRGWSSTSIYNVKFCLAPKIHFYRGNSAIGSIFAGMCAPERF
ncbi:hypothetical protein L596_017581 [Steinernema carpocapsae]|uniref:Uncharacterized protein n=1 Tax=Steinernema carpocapsae TaxID=34508 RepID=A0A4U5N245_STECR|nr:hypothetical protein L596_017581 [Steinernema carpocapsae]